jgi:hypothetical protein
VSVKVAKRWKNISKYAIGRGTRKKFAKYAEMRSKMMKVAEVCRKMWVLRATKSSNFQHLFSTFLDFLHIFSPFSSLSIGRVFRFVWTLCTVRNNQHRVGLVRFFEGEVRNAACSIWSERCPQKQWSKTLAKEMKKGHDKTTIRSGMKKV